MSDPVYTEEQKQELSGLLATCLYESLQQPKPTVADLVKAFRKEAKAFAWFAYDGNDHGLLPHLEHAAVYGAFEFFTDKRVELYFRSVFATGFTSWFNRTRPSLEKFLGAFPKSGAQKPTQEMMSGKVSSVGAIRTCIYRI